jgi:hypothetical protein
MPLFLVTISVHDGDWNKHLAGHVSYLQELNAAVILRATGRLTAARLRSGYLIAEANAGEIQAIVDNDPLAKPGLIAEVTIQQWNRLFGAFEPASSGKPPELEAKIWIDPKEPSQSFAKQVISLSPEDITFASIVYWKDATYESTSVSKETGPRWMQSSRRSLEAVLSRDCGFAGHACKPLTWDNQFS